MTVPAVPLNPDQAHGLQRFGAIVRQARRDTGISQHTLAKVVGIDQSVISRLEAGKLTGLRFRHVGAIVAALDRSVEFWMGFRAPPSTRRLPHATEDVGQ